MAKTVWVMGARGRLGAAVAQAFVAAGWRVRAPWRHGAGTPPPALPGVEWLVSDEALRAAQAQGADVLVHAMNPARYTAAAWRAEAPAMLRSAIDQSLALGALLLFPGNVYNNRQFATPHHIGAGEAFAVNLKFPHGQVRNLNLGTDADARVRVRIFAGGYRARPVV